MTTAQDQQSRAELSDFEAWYAKQCMRSDDAKQGLIRAWVHLAWQAARALPAGIEPAASVYTMEALVPGGREVAHVSLRQPLPAGTALYTAAQVQAMGRVPPGFHAVPIEPNPAEFDRFGWKAAPRPPAAQERKPLTDEQISDMRGADLGALNFVTLREFRTVARAVEAAHGIKEAGHGQQT